MSSPAISRIESAAGFAARFAVSRETVEKLETYERMLRRWQKTINLVAPSTLDDIWHRHFADSAQVYFCGLELVHERRPDPAAHMEWLDIGSGAGFPGLVIAILAAEAGGSRHCLIESDSRKAAFLREAARACGVVVDIVCARIESPQNHAKVGQVDFVTARALAPLPLLVELAYPYFGPATAGLFLKGREAAAEVEEAARLWRFAYEAKPSVTDKEGRVLVLQSLKRKSASLK